MNRVVVDTDVVSLVFKQDTRAQEYLSTLAARDLLVSFMTEAELERWILQSRWGQWAAVMVVARSVARRIEVADAWIAATALLYDAPLVTNNPGDYSGARGLKLAP